MTPSLAILVVDDAPDVGNYMVEILTTDGHQAKHVAEAAFALEEIRGGSYHIVIVDICLPGVSGLDLMEQIRALDSDVALVVLTGHPSVDTAAASIRFGVSAYIRKPVDADELREILARIAKHKGLARPKEVELYETIGRRIRELRNERGLTLKQLARRTDLSVSLLSQMERAESSASLWSLYKVATALDVSLAQLFSAL